MSLRDSYEQSLYETWSFDVVDACKAAGVPCPTDFAMRWHLGHSVEDIVREMGGTVKQEVLCA